MRSHRINKLLQIKWASGAWARAWARRPASAPVRAGAARAAAGPRGDTRHGLSTTDETRALRPTRGSPIGSLPCLCSVRSQIKEVSERQAFVQSYNFYIVKQEPAGTR